MAKVRGVIDRVLACTLATAGCGGQATPPPGAGARTSSPPPQAAEAATSTVPAPVPSASAAPAPMPPSTCTKVGTPSASAVSEFPLEPPSPFDDASPDRWAAERFGCDNDAFSFLTPAVPVDYLSLRAAGTSCGSNCGISILDQRGQACDGVADHASCLASIDGLYRPDGWPQNTRISSTNVYLLSTRADEVATYATYGELVKFLGPIDSGAEADLLVTLQGAFRQCTPGAGPDGYAAQDDGWDVLVSRCDVGGPRLLYHVTRAGVTTLVGKHEDAACGMTGMTCGIGRRPGGLVDAAPAAEAEPLGRFFAEVAHLEAASVHAFDRLAADLARHEAPESLVGWARRSALEEVRHAVMTTGLARRFGGVPAPVEIAPRGDRSLEDLATENATEGCVRETYGAAVARWQAARSTDPEIARAMTAIAEDETRHAELSWAIARWAEERLDAPARERVASARREAARALRDELREPLRAPSRELELVAGLPSRHGAMRLFAALSAELSLAT